MPFKEINIVYSDNRMKPTNTLCRRQAELFIVRAGGKLPLCFKVTLIVCQTAHIGWGWYQG
jgi:hypothetical protein